MSAVRTAESLPEVASANKSEDQSTHVAKLEATVNAQVRVFNEKPNVQMVPVSLLFVVVSAKEHRVQSGSNILYGHSRNKAC